MLIRAAQPADVPVIEQLTLEIFPTLASNLRVSPDALHQTLVRLRMAEATPTKGIFVAEHSSALVGMVFVDTLEHRPISLRAQWRIARHLGIIPALRLLWVLNGLRYTPKANEAYFNGIGIKPDFRQQGIPHALMDEAEAYALNLGKRCLSVFIAQTNIPSQRIALRRGWKQVPHRSALRRMIATRTHMLRFEKDV